MRRRQALGVVPLVGAAESAHLPARQTQHPGGLPLGQPPLDHPLDDPHPIVSRPAGVTEEMTIESADYGSMSGEDYAASRGVS